MVFIFFTLLGHIAFVNNSIAFIAGITPTNYSVSYVRNSKIDDAHKRVSLSRNFKLHDIAQANYQSINSQTVYYLQGSRGSTVAQPIKQGMIGL